MLAALALPAFNRVLRSNVWALERLRLHAGKIVRFESGPVVLGVQVQATGEFEPAPGDGEPATVVRVLPGAVLRLATHDAAAWSEVAITGDSELAAVLHQVWQQLDWGIEEDLSQIFGDIVAHRLVTTGQTLQAGAAHAAQSVLRNVFEYWTEEQPVVASRGAIDAYVREVDALRDDVARLEKRIAALRPPAVPEYGPDHTTRLPGQ